VKREIVSKWPSLAVDHSRFATAWKMPFPLFADFKSPNSHSHARDLTVSNRIQMTIGL
jgi:hypothetical protein